MSEFRKDFTIKIGDNSETILTIKFKDPRDALKYLVNGINNLTQEVVKEVFGYVEYGYNCDLYSIKETYHYLMLCFQVENFVTFPHSWFLKLDAYSTIEEVKKAYDTLEVYKDNLNSAVRTSHKFAVANTWKVWNDTQIRIKKSNLDSSENIVTKEDIERFSVSNEGYKGKKVRYEIGFLLSRRLWRVVFEDNSWIIASDYGNGWYKPFTGINSYKIIENKEF